MNEELALVDLLVAVKVNLLVYVDADVVASKDAGVVERLVEILLAMLVDS